MRTSSPPSATAIPSLGAGIYLNTGSVGPAPGRDGGRHGRDRRLGARHRPRPTSTPSPTRCSGWPRPAPASPRSWARTCPSVALTHSTTDGMNAATLAIDWQPGRPGGHDPTRACRRPRPALRPASPWPARRSSCSMSATTATTPGRSPRSMRPSRPGPDSCRCRTSPWTTGAILPIAAIAEIAHARGALVVVDGAQAAGAIPIRFDDLGRRTSTRCRPRSGCSARRAWAPSSSVRGRSSA